VRFVLKASWAEREETLATTVTDLPELLKGFPPGAWVAISESQNKALAFGIDAQTVHDEAQQLGEEQPLMVRVPDQTMAMFL
jgi:hypothetical protein